VYFRRVQHHHPQQQQAPQAHPQLHYFTFSGEPLDSITHNAHFIKPNNEVRHDFSKCFAGFIA